VTIAFVPQRGQILMCDFSMAHVPPEMRKQRRAVVVSPRSYNARHGQGPGRCIVVPFSASPPKTLKPSDVPFPTGPYKSLTVDTWAICEAVMNVSHERLDRVATGQRFLSEAVAAADMARIEDGLRHALGLPVG
jgi:uncharacterized protein YifN (PemK superfamily)